MSITWDDVDQRNHQSGLDRGVLYLPNGSAVPWNGLTSVIESFDKSSSPVYYDGMKINDLVSLGSFSANMKAFTYPDEFTELEGLAEVRDGVFYADQMPQLFGLCYRTQVYNAAGDVTGYIIHVLYNVTAMPNSKTHLTESASATLAEFEWVITAVPEEIPGFSPTAHIIIDTAKVDPLLLIEIEKGLYGDGVIAASLIPMDDLVAMLTNWFILKITDNGNGTWTASTTRTGIIVPSADPTVVHLLQANVVYLDSVTYRISDTADADDIT